jgi:hypothetical protein
VVVPIRRSKRSTPSIYRRNGDQENHVVYGLNSKNKKVKMMKGLFWNIRGMSKKGVAQYVRDLLSEWRF